MSRADVWARMERLRDDVFIEEDVDKVRTEFENGALTEDEATRQLDGLERRARFGLPAPMGDGATQQEWTGLLAAMAEEATAWQALARSQYYQGLVLMPLAMVVVFAAVLLSAWRLPDSLVAVSSVGGACLAAAAAHAFFVLRIHQQARLAAERLSEKRAAVLFLRLAVGRRDRGEVNALLAAGTAMFLGHHAATAIPLQPDDLRKAAS